MRNENREQGDCPCGSQALFGDCCGPYLAEAKYPATAEQLMRSRYTAYTLCAQHYLRNTWHPDTRPSRVSYADDQRWLGLKIYACEEGGESDLTGTVEFAARYKIGGKGHRLREKSRFEKVDGRWYYLEGEHL